MVSENRNYCTFQSYKQGSQIEVYLLCRSSKPGNTICKSEFRDLFAQILNIYKEQMGHSAKSYGFRIPAPTFMYTIFIHRMCIECYG